MILTDAGQVLVLQVREGLNTLSQAFDEVRARPRRTGASSTLTVSVLPSFAIRWLVRVGQLAIDDASSWFLPGANRCAAIVRISRLSSAGYNKRPIAPEHPAKS
jgi:hypothetical protein